MFSGKIKYEVSDPAFYGPLIAEQKKRVRDNSRNAEQWLELGRLREARIDMINNFAKHNWGIRFFMPIYTVLVIISACIYYFVFINPNLTNFLFYISIITIFMVVMMGYLWLLRYPPSGAKYFKKAIKLNSKCGGA